MRKWITAARFARSVKDACRLLVNFTDYLDTGLFLDHRLTRRCADGARS